VNLATSLYFGAESEFIIAAQTFSSLRIAILLCWGGLGLDNIFFESDAVSKLYSVNGFVVIWIPQ